MSHNTGVLVTPVQLRGTLNGVYKFKESSTLKQFVEKKGPRVGQKLFTLAEVSIIVLYYEFFIKNCSFLRF